MRAAALGGAYHAAGAEHADRSFDAGNAHPDHADNDTNDQPHHDPTAEFDPSAAIARHDSQ